MSVVCTGVKPVSQDGNEANESQECSAEQPQQMAGAGGATIINQVPADIAQEQQLDGVGEATTSNQVVAQRAGPEQVDGDGSGEVELGMGSWMMVVVGQVELAVARLMNVVGWLVELGLDS